MFFSKIDITIIEHGEPEQLHNECGYDAESIKNAVIKLLEPEFAKL